VEKKIILLKIVNINKLKKVIKNTKRSSLALDVEAKIILLKIAMKENKNFIINKFRIFKRFIKESLWKKIDIYNIVIIAKILLNKILHIPNSFIIINTQIIKAINNLNNETLNQICRILFYLF
jgi:hypothetical protein